MRLRFPVSALPLGLALGLAAAPLAAHAQEKPAAAPAAAQARVDDIQISQTADSVSILVKLSAQPKAASAKQANGALELQIDGVTLPQSAFDPAGDTLVRHVVIAPVTAAADTSKIRLEGAAFGAASTTIYRNAVLIETKLADASLPSAASLMKQPDAKKPATATQSADALQSHPAPGPAPVEKASLPTPPPAPEVKSTSLASIAKLDAAACASASAQLEKDAWSLLALGDNALCLIDEKKFSEARKSLDQLAAFSPEDWRVSLGRAALSDLGGDASNAEIGYRNAAMLAPDQATRDAINGELAKLVGPAIN
ncbi:MAG: hypothetical protein GC155_14405 [Alphaproteobacteria bacterium]|nr:hypothetical protein [Alphaproteobacteria bacterium]